ncbi:MAG: hypothetical protein U0R17_04910 [Acidimicrobiia bacterium]
MLFTTTATALRAATRTHAQESLEMSACLHKLYILHKKDLMTQGELRDNFEYHL